MPDTHASEREGKLCCRHLFSLLFLLLIALPAILSLTGTGGSSASAQKKAKAPGAQLRTLLEPEYYHAWEQYLDSRLAPNGVLLQAKRWLDYRLFNMTDMTDVYVGLDGWLFARRDIDRLHKGTCDQETHIKQLLLELKTIAHLVDASGRRFFFSVAPGKSTIYKEYVGNVPKDPSCPKSLYELLLDEQDKHALNCFVRLDRILQAAKTPESMLYSKTGLTWNARGAHIAAQALLHTIFSNGDTTGGADKDLKAAILGETTPAERSSADPGMYRLSSAVVYGDAAMAELLPDLARPFNRLDAIAADTIPSPNHGENLSAYDTVLVVVDESQLQTLQFDFDELCRMLSVDALADTQNSIPLQTFTAETHLSLNYERGRLAVKSLGADAHFMLPSLPGSDAATLRILAMNITTPTTDRLTWSMVHSSTAMGTKQIRAGMARIYLPMPVQAAVRLRINPGQSTGLFFISEATVLEFSNGLSGQTSAHDGSAQSVDAFRGPDARPNDEPMKDHRETSTQSSVLADDVAPTIQLNDFEAMRIFQRSGSTADIIVSGTYSGRPTAIEACILRHGSDAVVTPWRVIDSAPDNGVFLGIMAEVPQGGWYRLAVRFADQHDIAVYGQSPWGVGMLVGCIGQSNMNEWFYAGKDLSAHSLLALHREGQWQPMDQTGNGAIAFGNRLIGKLGIPVGLLDYAVNGSGLRKEADWGAGYWADRSDQSIYSAFMKGVAATGGSLEYIVWMQGEADAARGTITENQYRNALTTFIQQQVRQDIVNGSAQPHLPFLVVDMVKRPVGKDAPHQAIHNALKAATQEVADCYLAAITLDLKNLGHQHLAPEAYTILGLRVAQAVLFLLGDESYYRGPSVVGAEKVNDHTIYVRLAHRGGFDFSPASDITGWQALLNGESIPIAGVWRQDFRTVGIELARPVEGPVTLRYLYGAMPDADRAIHDNSAMELPLEPAQLEVK